MSFGAFPNMENLNTNTNITISMQNNIWNKQTTDLMMPFSPESGDAPDCGGSEGGFNVLSAEVSAVEAWERRTRTHLPQQ